jgi:hypothetical protein
MSAGVKGALCVLGVIACAAASVFFVKWGQPQPRAWVRMCLDSGGQVDGSECYHDGRTHLEPALPLSSSRTYGGFEFTWDGVTCLDEGGWKSVRIDRSDRELAERATETIRTLYRDNVALRARLLERDAIERTYRQNLIRHGLTPRSEHVGSGR